MALCDNWYYGNQYKNDEVVGNYCYILQLCLCLHTRFTYGYRSKYNYLFLFIHTMYL